MPALRAGGGSRPRPLGASLPPPSGLLAATPAHPGRLGRRPPRPPVAVGELWRLVAACGGSGLRPCGACQPPAVARGHPVGPQGQAPCGGRFAGLAPRQPRAGRGVGAPARPGPHSVGAVGPSAPPARSGLAPASRPALARLRLCPRWCGSAYARPARRSGPAPLRRPAAEPRGGVRALWARPVRGRNFYAARKGLARFAGRGPVPRFARGWGAGLRRLRAGLPHRKPSDKAKTSRLRRALSDDLRCGIAQIRAMPRPDASIRRQKNPLPHAAGFLQASTCRPKSLCSKNGVNRQEAG